MERSNSLNLAVISGTICLLFSTPTLWADISNGDFSSDLSVGWDSYGVSIFQEKAIFYEGNSDKLDIFYLQQRIDIEEDLQLLSFNISIDNVAIGGDTDYFNVFLDGIEIHKWDSSADPLIVPAIPWTYYCPFPMTDVWLRFELDFDYIPVPGTDPGTELFTHVELDNVKLTPVPGAVVLGSMGLSFAGWMLRRKKT